MSVKMEVLGVPETKRFLTMKRKKYQGAIGTAMRKAGFFVEGEVKQSIAGRKAEPKSVDTGRFMGSVKSEASKDNAVISSNVEYAKFLEYGTTRLRARQHFRNSKERSRPKVRQIIEEEVKSV